MFKVEKQTVCDWFVSNDGAAHAWIERKGGLYIVRFVWKFCDRNARYSFPTFKEAKEFAAK